MKQFPRDLHKNRFFRGPRFEGFFCCKYKHPINSRYFESNERILYWDALQKDYFKNKPILLGWFDILEWKN